MKHILEIKNEEQRATVATILYKNGYTVKDTVILKPGAKTKIKVLEYCKEEKK